MDGIIDKIPASMATPSPHMGWNQVSISQSHPVLADLAEGSYLYFVHSYAAPVTNNTLATTTYGYRFAAACAVDNFIGVQFHPERSGRIGAQLLENFLALS